MSQDLILAASEKYGVPADLLARMMKQESGGNPKAVSPKGATGLLQLMPATAKHYGVTDMTDPVQNVDAGARYMADLIKQYKGNTRAAVAHYNGGTSQGKLVAEGKEPTYDETRKYVSIVIPQGAQTQGAQGSTPPGNQSRESPMKDESRQLRMGIVGALSQGIAEEDIVKSLASHPKWGANVQGALKAGATPQQVLQSAGGDAYTNFMKDKAAHDPTKGMSTTQKVLAGAGGRFMDYWQGMKQLTGNAKPEDVDEKRRLDAPLMATGAGKAGSVLTDVATSLALPAGAATTAGRVGLGALGGGVQGGVTGVGTGESRLQNAAIGAGAGAAGGALARPIERAVEWAPAKIANIARGRWTDPAERELFDRATAAGVSLRPSQQGSKVAGLVEKGQRYTPVAGGILQRAEQEQAGELANFVERTAQKFSTPRIQQEGAERVVLDSVAGAADAAKKNVSASFDKVADAAKKTGTTSVEIDGLRNSALNVKSELQDVFDKFGLSKLRGRVDQVIEGTRPQAGAILNAQGQPIMHKVALSFDDARALREDIGSAIKAAEKASFTGGATEKEVGALKLLFKGLEQDLDKWGDKNKLVKGLWDKARDQYKTEYFEVFKQPGNVRKMLRPDFDADRVVSSSLLPEHGAKAANLIKALDPEGQQAAKQLLIQRALSDFTTDPAKAARRLDFGKAGRQVFTQAELKEIDTLRELIRRINLGETPGKNMGASTSRMARQLAGGTALAAGLGAVTDEENRLGTLVGVPLALAGGAAALNTKAGRNLLMTSGKANLSPAARRMFGFGTQAAGQGLAQTIRSQLEEENAP